MITRNRLLQWYEVQDNKYFAIINFSEPSGRVAAAQVSRMDLTRFFPTAICSCLCVSLLASTSFRQEETVSSSVLSLFVNFVRHLTHLAFFNTDRNDAFIGVGTALMGITVRFTGSSDCSPQCRIPSLSSVLRV